MVREAASNAVSKYKPGIISYHLEDVVALINEMLDQD
jgi:hypothetical protein